jgi:mono/diheme cytochrome c family protein
MTLKKSRAATLSAVAGAMLIAGLIGLRAQDNPDEGWQIPANAAKETNPVASDDKVLAKGKDIYKSKCQKCHGVSGKGDGPDADPKHKPGNLTDGSRASRNPDGVMFYKLWNGRAKPKMPAFKSEMSKEDIWTVITYVKTLRQPG